MRALLLMLSGVLVAGCQSMESKSSTVVFAGGDGSCCEQAVVIRNAEFRETGLLAEKVWLDRRFPDRHETKQSELALAGKHYDLIELTTAENRAAKVYFDSTDWFA